MASSKRKVGLFTGEGELKGLRNREYPREWVPQLGLQGQGDDRAGTRTQKGWHSRGQSGRHCGQAGREAGNGPPSRHLTPR